MDSAEVGQLLRHLFTLWGRLLELGGLLLVTVLVTGRHFGRRVAALGFGSEEQTVRAGHLEGAAVVTAPEDLRARVRLLKRIRFFCQS